MYLEHASKELKDDKEIVRVAIHNRGSALKYASTRLKDDEVLVFEATEKSHYAIQYVSLRFREDKDIVLRLMSKMVMLYSFYINLKMMKMSY